MIFIFLRHVRIHKPNPLQIKKDIVFLQQVGGKLFPIKNAPKLQISLNSIFPSYHGYNCFSFQESCTKVQRSFSILSLDTKSLKAQGFMNANLTPFNIWGFCAWTYKQTMHNWQFFKSLGSLYMTDLRVVNLLSFFFHMCPLGFALALVFVQTWLIFS